MTKRNGKPIHRKALGPSIPDTVALGREVEGRFLDLCAAHLRIRGIPLPIPKSLDPDILRWRQMRVRHKSGDLRNSEAELQSVRTIAQWSLDINCAIRNQTPKVIQWRS